jgi:hypothetical protein
LPAKLNLSVDAINTSIKNFKSAFSELEVFNKERP